ncbi:site-specific DNA-methyltransferase [Candidatus Bathyarchaeota archaeon]|nr:site-specific DNA-methyltransferase [Candidatus Bathyarchaeota archaeon]
MNANSGNHVERRKKDSARLVWDTKPKRAANPKDIEFQTAEVVIPNPHRDQARLPSFMENLSKTTIDKPKMNRLIWGDNLLAMQALLASGYEGKIDVIYIDPPFWTGENYYTSVTIGQQTIEQSPSVAERLAFKDWWSGGIDSYIDVLYPRLQLMRRLLSDTGAIYLHLDWHLGHYMKVIMDEIFGIDNFRNEIQVKRIRKNVQEFATVKRLNVATDMILFYAKTPEHRIKPPTTPQKKEARWHALDAEGLRTGMDYELFGKKPPRGRHWMWTKERAEKAIADGTLRSNPRTGRPEYLIPESEEILLTTLWDDKSAYSFKWNWPTEKNEVLLERILQMSARDGALVADFFCGSGTTVAVAEKMRDMSLRWIGVDYQKVAIQTTRNRLVETESRPFLIENIGNYQRHMIYLSGVRIYEMQKIVLKLYGATPREDLPDLGTKTSVDQTIELIYVGYPDRPVTAKKVEELAHLADRLDGIGYKRLVILGWDYEYNYEELLRERKRFAENKWKTEVLNKAIPPEVYEYLKTARTEEEIEPLRSKIHFHEKPYLKLAPPEFEKLDNSKAKVTVGIERYVVFDYPIEDETKRQEIMEIVQKQACGYITTPIPYPIGFELFQEKIRHSSDQYEPGKLGGFTYLRWPVGTGPSQLTGYH